MELHVKLRKTISNIIAGNKIPTGNGNKLKNALQLGLAYTALPWQKEVKDNFCEMLFYT